MNQFENLTIIKKEKASVSVLLKFGVPLKTLTGNIGLDNLITDKNLHRPQLALAGFVDLFTFQRIQIFGNTEIEYLRSLSPEKRLDVLELLCSFPMPCIIVTSGNPVDDDLLNAAKQNNIAVFSTELETTVCSSLLSEYLDDIFAAHCTVHGSFVDVYGVGILFVGKSGIGKSEIALDLVERGHRLVADDIIILNSKRDAILMGTGTDLVQHFMEIRGLGIIDVRQMFGIRSIRFQKRLEIIVELEVRTESSSYTRLGLEDSFYSIMGVPIQCVKLGIFPGKNITVIAEVIALNYLLKTYGYNAAEVFSDKLRQAIEKKSQKFEEHKENRIITYFQGDNE